MELLYSFLSLSLEQGINSGNYWTQKTSHFKPVFLYLGKITLLYLYFSGFLSLDVVCYIWDQYILSMKLPSFNCIATFSAVMLLLLRDEILVCRNVRLKYLICPSFIKVKCIQEWWLWDFHSFCLIRPKRLRKFCLLGAKNSP